MGKIERIDVSVEDRETLRRLARDRNTPQKVVWRAMEWARLTLDAKSA